MKHTQRFLFLVLAGVAAFPACSSNSAAKPDAGSGGSGGGAGGTGGSDAAVVDGGSDAMPGIMSYTAPYPTFGMIEKLDPELDMVIAPTAKLEKLAEGFIWSEGPLWIPTKNYLLFTDVPADTIYKWEEGKGVTVWLKPAGCHNTACTMVPEPGANGLALDKDGGLLMCQHGNRRLAKLANVDMPMAAQTVVVDKYMTNAFNSPNDLVVHSSGSIFFTDPPYGSKTQTHTDPELKIGFQGVYRWDPMTSMLTVLDMMTERPNGIALSPDEKTLYVANSHDTNPIWVEYKLMPDLSIMPNSRRVFFDAKMLLAAGRVGGNDGIAVDNKGYLFATGPGGTLIFNPAGKHLGTILTTQRTSNNKLGGADGKTLFITADPFLARIQVLNAVAGKP